MQSWFRRSAMWAFWKLDWLIKKDLFWTNMKRQKPEDAEPQDPMERIYGTIIPKNIPESSALWSLGPVSFALCFGCTVGCALRLFVRHQQAKDLYAITEPSENGMMSCMTSLS